MQTFPTAALRLSKVAISTRTMYGVAAATALVAIAGVSYMVWKNRQPKDVTSTPNKQEYDDETRQPQTEAGDTSAGTGAYQGQDGADRDPPAPVPAADGSHRPEPAVNPTLSDKVVFFETAAQLARPIAAGKGDRNKKPWSESLASIIRADVFKTSEPRVLLKHERGDIVIFPTVPSVAVLLVRDKKGEIKLAYMVDNKVVMEVFDPVEAAEINRPLEIRGQAIRFVYEKMHELMHVRSGKIHPMLAYPTAFKTDGANLPQHILKKVGDQNTERAFFDKLFEESNLSVENPWTRSNAAYISAVLNSPVVPPALEPVRHGNLEGDRFIHVSDLSGTCNLVLIHRSTGILQIARADTAENSVNLRRVTGFENWFAFTNDVFDLSKEEHRRIAYFINPHTAQAVLEASAEQ